MDLYEVRLSQELEATLYKRISDLTSGLITTVAPDHADYRQRVGHIRGLKDALDILKLVQAHLSTSDTKQTERANRAITGYEL